MDDGKVMAMLPESPVYVDIMFLINLVMDFFIMWATAKLVGVKIVLQRLLAAALLGAIYSVGSVFPELSTWYDFPIKIIFSALLVILAFWPDSWKQFFKLWGYFYGVSFAMAGATIGSSYLFKSLPQAANSGFSYLWLGGGICCALFLGTYGDRIMRERVIPQVMNCPVAVRFGSNWCEGSGFIDTGNNLIDPLTNRPVVIAEYQLISACFPVDVRTALETNRLQGDLFDALADTSWAHRVRMIPFTSIGKSHGLMVGVRSDELAVQAGNKRLTKAGVVVGLYLEKISPEGSFQMLLPASIFKD
jgi:stage II sporulation protein GA (sporulation sigma-E factor processing peptidase)